MPFHFRLDGLLRLRKSVERQQELLLAGANQQVASIEQRIADVRATASALAAQQAQALAGRAAASELHLYISRVASLTSYEQALHQDFANAQRLRAQRCAAFAQARRQRELPETLRSRLVRAYREQESRREQRAIDDLHLILRASRVQHP